MKNLVGYFRRRFQLGFRWINYGYSVIPWTSPPSRYKFVDLVIAGRTIPVDLYSSDFNHASGNFSMTPVLLDVHRRDLASE